jgi:hypothetical protein
MASPPHSPNPNPKISSTNNGKKDSKSGCQVPFVAAGEGSSLTRFKQLSTRRGGRPRTKQRTVSSPGLVSEGFEVLGEPNLVGIGQPSNDNAPLVSAHLPLHWTAFSDATEDHPGHRKESGFFQPIRHLSGNLQKATSHC